MNAIVKNQPKDLAATIMDMKPQIAAALPKHISADRIARIALTALRSQPKLGACDPQSFLGSLMLASQLGLEPNTPQGQCYLIPRSGQCTFQIGYQGLIDLAYRSKLYEDIYAESVYEGDEFRYSLGFNKTLHHVPKQGARVGQPIAYYAVYKFKEGSGGFAVMFREEVAAHAQKYSASFNNGAWKTDFDAMAKKTVIKKALKYAPKSIELSQAFNVLDNSKIEVDLVASAQHGEPVYNTTIEEADFSEAKKDFAETPAGGLLL